MATTLLVDSNALRHPGLKAYLQSSRDHYVALSDLTLVEMRKRNALRTSRESLQIVGAFPNQVFVLRRTDLMLDEQVRNDADRTKLFDYQAGIELAKRCRELTILPVPAWLRDQMGAEEQEAREIMERLTAEVAEFQPALVDAAKDFTAAELTQIRTGVAVTDTTRRKLLDLLKETTGSFILRNQEPGRRAPMKLTDAMSLFAFRYSLCMLLYYMTWVRRGRTDRKLSRRVNDTIDMQVAAMATFFNGVLSADDDLQSVSHGARAVLRGFGGFVGEDWVPPAAAAAATGNPEV